ncbi:sulfite exporter TauE/SafE family protein [Lampropedia puyangensis]|uniref:Probable membrane transporter protein n=1 Tax=Lampropedia puyangensis TaxID=1330072 RepID=A0A4S8EN98_9BURK|nr:sulfite exporter TauE/SafE family protein [Lampropedia puyangensis]THT96177.1 sulfite exporter TauE/SafE family protein [Lampropedia puyangensis]
MDMVWVVAIGAIAAGLVQGISGFGFGMVAMSIWAWVIDPQLAAVLAVFGALLGQIIAAVTVRRGFDIRVLLPFVLGGLVGVPLGTWLLPQLDVHWFKALLGGFLVLFCPIMLYSSRLPRLSKRPRWVDALTGLIGGVMGGLGGMTGTVPTLWCTWAGMPKELQRAVIQNFNLTMLMVTMLTYAATGLVSRDVWPLFAVVAPAMLIPSLLGARLYKGLSEQRFKQLVLGLLTVSGITLLVAAVPKLLA